MDVEMIDQELADAVRASVISFARVLDPGHEPCVELHPVARLESGVLDDGRAALGTEAESANALAQLNGSSAMAEPKADEADGSEIHRSCMTFKGGRFAAAGRRDFHLDATPGRMTSCALDHSEALPTPSRRRRGVAPPRFPRRLARRNRSSLPR
jgi:hypothetical protein